MRAALICMSLLALLAPLCVAQPYGQRLRQRSDAAKGDSEEDFYRLFMIKRLSEKLRKRDGDFDSLMNQLEQLNRDSAASSSDSMIFRLKKRPAE